METLHQQMQQIVELQDDCVSIKQTMASMAIIHTMEFSMAKLYIRSFGTKEDETIQQKPTTMEMELVDKNSTNIEVK